MASSHPADSLENFNSVLSVQELIKKPTVSIPQPYVQFDVETFVSDNNSFPSVPTIDLELLLSKETAELELEKLHSTCIEWGLFQLVNHGVSSSLLDQLKHEIEAFYVLPLEEKMKYKVREGDFEGYGTVARLRGKLDWGDRLYFITNPIHRRKPHLLPELPSSMRNILESYILEVQNLAKKLLGFLADCLKIDKKEMEEMFDDGNQAIRMTYYPPCPQPKLALRITPHSDGSGITILNQVNEVDGLQVKKDGALIPVSYLPDAFVVNLGDILETLSDGLYHSIEHRATVNSEKERISVAFFVSPKFETEVKRATSLLNPQNPPIFRRMPMEKYVQAFFSRKTQWEIILGAYEN